MKNLLRNKSLSDLLLVATVVFILGATGGCRTAKKVPVDSQIKLSQPWIFGADFQKVLYKTNMMIYGNELSGLSLIKRKDKDFRVVFMSELGLKYFDMEFFTHNDSIKVHHLISLLDKKPVLDLLEDNFSLIFMLFPKKTKERLFQDPITESMVKEFKYKRNRSRYTYHKNFGQVSTIHKKHGGSNLVISLSSFDHLAPQTINFNQRNLSLRLEKIEP